MGHTLSLDLVTDLPSLGQTPTLGRTAESAEYFSERTVQWSSVTSWHSGQILRKSILNLFSFCYFS